jgi:hypothetical protein
MNLAGPKFRYHSASPSCYHCSQFLAGCSELRAKTRRNELKQIIFTFAAIALSGCTPSIPMEPYQIGESRYKLNYRGSEEVGAEKAQAFCRTRGFNYANINDIGTPDLDTAWRMGVGFDKRQIDFFCMHNGDKIEYPPVPPMIPIPSAAPISQPPPPVIPLGPPCTMDFGTMSRTCSAW